MIKAFLRWWHGPDLGSCRFEGRCSQPAVVEAFCYGYDLVPLCRKHLAQLTEEGMCS
jgi:hypothetical protein